MNFIRRYCRSARRNKAFHGEFLELERLSASTRKRFALTWEDRYPCLDDRTGQTQFDPHYIYHTAWAARKLSESRPTLHVDISSSLYFCSLVSAFIPVDFYDFRPAPLLLSGLTCRKADLTRLPFQDASVISLSCMHVAEHVGLGRYGDPFDYDGDLKAMSELCRVLAPGGRLLFAVPVGRPRICFNAHRIYSHAQVVEGFPGLLLDEFTLIPDSAGTTGPIEHCDPARADAQEYGCGCFLFRRP